MIKQILTLSLLIIGLGLQAQTDIVGTWYTIDDEDGTKKSHVKIYESNGKLEGKVVKLLEGAKSTHCNKCDGANKGKPIVGMKILWDMEKVGNNEYDDGEILSPTNGKVYSCSLELESKDKLKVRGYLGFSVLGRTQYWHRVK